MNLTKEQLAETENMTDQEQEQYTAYCEEQDVLEIAFNKQEKLTKIEKVLFFYKKMDIKFLKIKVNKDKWRIEEEIE